MLESNASTFFAIMDGLGQSMIDNTTTSAVEAQSEAEILEAIQRLLSEHEAKFWKIGVNYAQDLLDQWKDLEASKKLLASNPPGSLTREIGFQFARKTSRLQRKMVLMADTYTCSDLQRSIRTQVCDRGEALGASLRRAATDVGSFLGHL